ncbi:thiamine pyrophosphate-requiring protein [Methylobacterium dankookense]|uniref:Acetolactate synthase large subunit n=1 Tax=Methylobacterium dankookense TaxID=560405 RepID=A0A564FRC6_9HYPH|nr:thiamine pyrophosphate-requiring protein [Methylobacterium dankookense]GJD56863.1 Acetolactate synthase large subunit [Methylobacterium dankookense]VUF10733.1 Acetolactate synthase large subunit [Methylobacterium dankookense]
MKVELQPGERAGEVRSAADVLLRQLTACGIDYFFANGGTDFPPIAEAFARAETTGEAVPRPMVIPHENLAVAMAHGVYMVSGRPQAVMVHVNVGTANAVNAVLDASRDETPVLLFAGRSPYSEAGRHGARTRYIHWAQEMFDQAGMLREAVKWDYELHLPEQAGEIVTRAHQVAMSAPRGPVYVTLPRDTLAGAAALPGAPAAPVLAPVPAPFPDPAAVARLAGWLAEAERPVIVTASAGRSEAGFRALAGFAERHAVPVVSFHQRFLNIATDHPCFAGFEPGPWIQDADLVIALDCDVPWIPSIQNPPEGARIAHLGIDPAYTRYPMRGFRADLCLPGEAAILLDALERALGSPLDTGRLAGRREAIARRRAPVTTPSARGTITPDWISACVAEAVGPEAIIVNEYPLRLDHCPRTRAGTYFGLSPAGGLGWGLGAALGAKLAAPDKLVVATLGDGAYIFANPTASHWAAAAHDLPVLTVVFNNALYGAVRNSTLAMYREGYAAKNRGRMLADLGPSPDFERVVEASGGLGLRVENAEALPGALAEAVAAVRAGRQALVNVVCEY